MTRARTNRRASCTETRTASARIDIYDPSSVRRIFHERAGPRSVDRQYFPREISKSDPRHPRIALIFPFLFDLPPFLLAYHFSHISLPSYLGLRSKRCRFPILFLIRG